MADTTAMGRPHPIIIIAAIAVILTCLVALAAMTGLIPMAKHSTSDVTIAPAPNTTPSANPALPPSASLAPKSGTQPQSTARSRTTERAPAVGSTSTAPGAGTLSGGTNTAAAPVAPPPPCTNCGTVVAVRTIKEQADASMIGPAAGALLGGVLGNQIGSGSGNKIATVVGAGVGAAAGTEVERRYKSTTSYVIDVRMEDGTVRHFSSPTAPAVQAGSKVKVVDGKLLMA